MFIVKMQGDAVRGRMKTLPPKISRVGTAADSVVVVSVAAVVVVVVEGGAGAVGAAMGAMVVGASLQVGGVVAVLASVLEGLIANRSSSGAISALPSVVAKGSSGGVAGGGVERLDGVGLLEKREKEVLRCG